MSVKLREITQENFYDCINLKVAKNQEKFVASNVLSIAQSKVCPHFVTLAIYNDDEIVGFSLYCKDPESKNYYIVRLMIDEKFQGKGFGKQATLKLIDLMSKNEDCNEVYLFFVKGNKGAESLYSSIGFEKTGVIDEDGEIEMKLDLKRQKHVRESNV